MNEAKEKSNNKKELINNLLTRIKERKWFLLAILIAWIILVICINPVDMDYSRHVVNSGYKISELRLTEEFEQDEERTFLVDAQINNLEQISLFAGTFGERSDSILNIKIIDTTNKNVIFDEDVDTADIYVQEYINCKFACPQEDSKNKEYEIIVKCVERNNTSLFLWERETIDGNGIVKKEPIIKLTYYESKLIILYIAILLVLLTVSIVLILYVKPKLDEKMFLFFAIILGICYLVFTPFPHEIDEFTHYFKSYLIANGNIYNDINSKGEIGGIVPDNFDEMQNAYEISLKTIFLKDNLTKLKYSDTDEFYKNIYLSSTIPIDHSVASIGILIAKIFDMNIVGYIILARGVTLAAYIVISYFAIKNMKYYKTTMFVILTLPIGLWMAGTVSVDPILHGAAFLFASICLKYFFDDNMENKVTLLDKVLIIVTAVCIISIKYLVYTPLVLLFFIIPKEKFKTNKEYIYMICMSIMIGILIIIWQFWMLGTFKYVEDRTSGRTGIEGQIEFIFGNVYFFVRTYIMSFANVWKESIQLTSSFAPIIIPSYFTFVAILEKEKYEFKGKKKRALILFAIIVISIVALVFLAEYLAWNPIGNEEIIGYQGRYIIPVLLLWGILIGNIIKVENKVGNYELMIALFVIVTNLNVIFGNIMTMFE